MYHVQENSFTRRVISSHATRAEAEHALSEARKEHKGACIQSDPNMPRVSLTELIERMGLVFKAPRKARLKAGKAHIPAKGWVLEEAAFLGLHDRSVALTKEFEGSSKALTAAYVKQFNKLNKLKG